MGTGTLIVKADLANDAVPIEGADVAVIGKDGKLLYKLKTDSSGVSETAALAAPDKAYSLDPDYQGIPYSTCRVRVSAPGFITEIINGVQIFDTVESVQEVELRPLLSSGETENVIDITPRNQVPRPPRVQEAQADPPAGVVALPRVIIPDFITVHLGSYTNASARNIRVPFPLYVKNVASADVCQGVFPNKY